MRFFRAKVTAAATSSAVRAETAQALGFELHAPPQPLLCVAQA
jgi:hypothetical protein